MTNTEEAFIRKSNALPKSLIQRQIDNLKSKAIFTPITNDARRERRDLMIQVVIELEQMMEYFKITDERKKIFNNSKKTKDKLKKKAGESKYPNPRLNAF